MKSTYIAAFVVAALFVAWLLSGQLGEDETRAPAPALAESRDALLAQSQDAPVRVRARIIAAESQTEDVIVRGRTEADRVVSVRAETSGRIEALPVDKGDRVARGDLLCRIAVDTREARVTEARQAVAQARIEFDGARELRERGFQSETAIAAAEARLAASIADLAQRELDLENTFVKAPFDGIVETRPVEIGDFLQAGGTCATVVDPDPMMLVGQVAEQDVGRLAPGQHGYGRLMTGETVAGEVAFVATTAAPTTRTFLVEVAVPNPDARLRDGITAELRIPVESFQAHRIPASILALDDAGELGVRIVDGDDRVSFMRVTVVKDSPEGLWVRGLPDPAKVITVGQELVTPGEQVDVVIEASTTLTGQAPDADVREDSAAGSTADAGLERSDASDSRAVMIDADSVVAAAL